MFHPFSLKRSASFNLASDVVAIFHFFGALKLHCLDTGCGTVDREAASKIRGRRFESSHQQFYKQTNITYC